jgi:hypothetical protein
VPEFVADSLLTEDASRTTGYRRTSGDYKIWQVIAASAVGTMIEWYDFYISAASPQLSLRSFIRPAMTDAT